MGLGIHGYSHGRHIQQDDAAFYQYSSVLFLSPSGRKLKEIGRTGTINQLLDCAGSFFSKASKVRVCLHWSSITRHFFSVLQASYGRDPYTCKRSVLKLTHVKRHDNSAPLTAFFQDNLGEQVPQLETFLDFTEAEMMGWQWHQSFAPRFSQITMPAPHNSVFYGRDALARRSG